MATLVMDCEVSFLPWEEDWRRNKTEILSVCSIFNTETQDMTSYHEDDIQEAIDVLLAADRIIGHNIKGFDFHVLDNYRPGIVGKLSPKALDTMLYLFAKTGRFFKLDDLGQDNVGYGKLESAVSPSRMFRMGMFNLLDEYNRQDVRLNWDLFVAGNVNKYLVVRDDEEIKMVEVEWEYENYPDVSLTESLKKRAG